MPNVAADLTCHVNKMWVFQQEVSTRILFGPRFFCWVYLGTLGTVDDEVPRDDQCSTLVRHTQVMGLFVAHGSPGTMVQLPNEMDDFPHTFQRKRQARYHFMILIDTCSFPLSMSTSSFTEGFTTTPFSNSMHTPVPAYLIKCASYSLSRNSTPCREQAGSVQLMLHAKTCFKMDFCFGMLSAYVHTMFESRDTRVCIPG